MFCCLKFMILNRNYIGAIFCVTAITCARLLAQSPPANPAAGPPAVVLPATPNITANKNADPPTPLEAATELYRSGKFGAAEAAFRAIMQSDPQSAPAY